MDNQPRDTCSIHYTIQKWMAERYETNERRWEMHLATQTQVNGEIYSKLSELNKEMSRLSSRVNYILGAAFVLMPVLQIVMHFIFNKFGKP